MKAKVAYIFIILGFLALLSQTLYTAHREKTLLEMQMQVQRSALIDGINKSWRSFLLGKARKGEIDTRFKLRWNRKGSELRELFFPMKKSTMNWDNYRSLLKTNRETETIDFLKRALYRDNSWDRVLAISEWHQLKGSYPDIKTSYEKTLIDREARSAYRAIFEQFSGKKDFTLSSREIELDRVFYKVSEDGSIEAFVPSTISVKNHALAEFARINNLPSAQLGETPWELVLPSNLADTGPFSYLDFVWLGFGFVFLGIGFIFYFGSLGDQKAVLLKRVSFLNQVVHELKTPLAGLKLHLQLVQRGGGTEKNMEALDSSLSRIDQLFDDIVLMNRPFEKSAQEKLDESTLKDLLAELLEEFSQASTFKFSASDVFADPKRLRVIIRNLIKNAIRYGRVAKVSVSTDKSYVFIDVEDEGPGVSESDQYKIFAEFYRSEEAKVKNADGLGLGLYLVSKISKEMGAEVSLLNPGQPHAVFRLTLRRSL